MKKKLVAAVLIAAMGVTLLSGCGKKAADQDTVINLTGDTELSDSAEENDSADASGEDQSAAEDEGAEQTEADTSASEDSSENLTFPELTTTDELQDLETVYMVGNTCYELYNYVDDQAEDYAKEVNYLADSLSGTANVYDLIIPTSMGITFPDNLADQTSCSDVRDSMDKIIAKLDSSVNVVDPYNTLMQHRQEYIYFRTDHHWTGLGAYYAYTDYCQAAGLTAHDISEYTERQYDGFLGSFYNDANQPDNLKNDPDTVYAYVPVTYESASMKVTDKDDTTFSWPILCDVSETDAGNKYGTFICGDNPYTVITNSSITDGSACLVVKESFGNAFVPYLVDHYQTIYVIDYRYWTGNLTSFAEENSVSDVILCNNISMIRNKYLVGQLGKVIY